jgi:hypothetical protein
MVENNNGGIMKVSMIKNDKVYGNRITTFNPTEHTRIGMGRDKDIEEKVKAALDEGRSLFCLGSPTEGMWYASKDTDGFTRGVREWCENHCWNRNIRVNPYEINQAVWEDDVKAWFSYAMLDDGFMKEMEAICGDMDKAISVMKKAENAQSRQTVPRAGKSGLRRECLDRYVIEVANGKKRK